MIEECKDGTSVHDIAKAHQRTSESISSRLKDIAVRKMKEGMTIEEACALVNVQVDELRIYIDKQEASASKSTGPDHQKSKQQVKENANTSDRADEHIKVLRDIRDYLRVMTEMMADKLGFDVEIR